MSEQMIRKAMTAEEIDRDLTTKSKGLEARARLIPAGTPGQELHATFLILAEAHRDTKTALYQALELLGDLAKRVEELERRPMPVDQVMLAGGLQ